MTRPTKQQTLSVIEAQFPSPRLGEDYLCLQAPGHICFSVTSELSKSTLFSLLTWRVSMLRSAREKIAAQAHLAVTRDLAAGSFDVGTAEAKSPRPVIARRH